MTAHRADPPALAQGGTLFLVEVAVGSPTSGAVDDMHAAFRHAVARVNATGKPIRWCAGWFLPTDGRCLCLIEAVDEACVVLACDTAALAAARVHPVRTLDRRTGPSPSLRSRGRS